MALRSLRAVKPQRRLICSGRSLSFRFLMMTLFLFPTPETHLINLNS